MTDNHFLLDIELFIVIFQNALCKIVFYQNYKHRYVSIFL